jgi:hypothetical protein
LPAVTPPLEEHALQGGVERALFDLQHVFGAALDELGDFVAVQAAADGECLQNQQVEGAGRDFVAVAGGVGCAAYESGHLASR